MERAEHDGSGTFGNAEYWRAPGKVLGYQLEAYGGSLAFDVGNAGSGNGPFDQEDIILVGGGITLVYDLARRLWNREAGFHAALLLLFTVQFTMQARRAQLDALLVFFTVLSLYCLLRQLLLGGGWRWAVGAGLAAGGAAPS